MRLYIEGAAGPEQIHVGCKALRVGGEALFLVIPNITGMAYCSYQSNYIPQDGQYRFIRLASISDNHIRPIYACRTLDMHRINNLPSFHIPPVYTYGYK